MVNYKHFVRHTGPYEARHVDAVMMFATPDDPTGSGGLPMFHTAACGADWYECQANFGKNTLKFCYDDAGVVQMASYDVSAIVPHCNWSVSEVDSKLTPEEVQWKYRFDGKNLVKIETPNEEVNDLERQRLFRILDARITVLKNKIDDEDYEDRHIVEIKSLRAIRVFLRNMDLSMSPSEIKWPELA